MVKDLGGGLSSWAAVRTVQLQPGVGSVAGASAPPVRSLMDFVANANQAHELLSLTEKVCLDTLDVAERSEMCSFPKPAFENTGHLRIFTWHPPLGSVF